MLAKYSCFRLLTLAQRDGQGMGFARKATLPFGRLPKRGGEGGVAAAPGPPCRLGARHFDFSSRRAQDKASRLTLAASAGKSAVVSSLIGGKSDDGDKTPSACRRDWTYVWLQPALGTLAGNADGLHPCTHHSHVSLECSPLLFDTAGQQSLRSLSLFRVSRRPRIVFGSGRKVNQVLGLSFPLASP